MSNFGITESGFILKRLIDIKEEKEKKIKALLGEAIDVSENSILGQIIGVVSEADALIWELMQDVYLSQYPDSAEGINLDRVATLSGRKRLEAVKSTVIGTPIGTAGTVVPAGTVISVDGAEDSRFITLEEKMIEADGTTRINMESEEAGEYTALAGTLAVIETPVAGLSGWTNEFDADVGRDKENDTEFRKRLFASFQHSKTGTAEGLRSAILQNVEDMSAVMIMENMTSETVNNIPPHSFHIVVSGGDEEKIAQEIYNAKASGIQAYGEIVKQVETSTGDTVNIGFSRPVYKPIYLNITVWKNEGTTITESEIKDLILEYGNNLSFGDNVIVYPKIMSLLTGLSIYDAEIKVGITSSPTQNNNIVINSNEIADFDSTKITIVIN
ncbi:MAG: hypothetical protein GY817_04695 [bacterium]|nr:hypothetical protein [bacterium]